MGLRAMRPFSKLICRTHRVLILLVLCAHSSGMFVERVSRHAFVNFFFVWDFDFAGELDVIVL
jgi:hypothetical protein